MRCSLATQITMRRGDHRYITTAAVRQLGAHNSQSPHLLSKTTIGRVQAAKQSAIRASASVSQELTQARKHPDQVSTAPAAGDLSYYRSFYDSFADNLERSSDSVWGNGQGAFSGAKVSDGYKASK